MVKFLYYLYISRNHLFLVQGMKVKDLNMLTRVCLVGRFSMFFIKIKLFLFIIIFLCFFIILIWLSQK
jgi:hypothetical protein